jgi:hypothetical protein
MTVDYGEAEWGGKIVKESETECAESLMPVEPRDAESSDDSRRIISTRSIKTTMKIATSMTIFLRSQNVISRLGYAPGA